MEYICGILVFICREYTYYLKYIKTLHKWRLLHAIKHLLKEEEKWWLCLERRKLKHYSWIFECIFTTERLYKYIYKMFTYEPYYINNIKKKTETTFFKTNGILLYLLKVTTWDWTRAEKTFSVYEIMCKILKV